VNILEVTGVGRYSWECCGDIGDLGCTDGVVWWVGGKAGRLYWTGEQVMML
jgi:hypothetical protein